MNDIGPSTRFSVVAELELVITVGDPSALARCLDNHDENGVPQPDQRGGSGWRNVYYPLTTLGQVLEHWTFNAVQNGITDVSRLDGWADLDPGVVTVSVEDTYVSNYGETVDKAGNDRA